MYVKNLKIKYYYTKLISGELYFTMSQNRLYEMESEEFEEKMACKMHVQ